MGSRDFTPAVWQLVRCRQNGVQQISQDAQEYHIGRVLQLIYQRRERQRERHSVGVRSRQEV